MGPKNYSPLKISSTDKNEHFKSKSFKKIALVFALTIVLGIISTILYFYLTKRIANNLSNKKPVVQETTLIPTSTQVPSQAMAPKNTTFNYKTYSNSLNFSVEKTKYSIDYPDIVNVFETKATNWFRAVKYEPSKGNVIIIDFKPDSLTYLGYTAQQELNLIETSKGQNAIISSVLDSIKTDFIYHNVQMIYKGKTTIGRDNLQGYYLEYTGIVDKTSIKGQTYLGFDKDIRFSIDISSDLEKWNNPTYQNMWKHILKSISFD